MSDSTKFDISKQRWYQKKGALPFPMTNDYLFRALCQKDSLALHNLICSVLRWDKDMLVSAEVSNPILIGKAIDDKEFVLDVQVTLNTNISLDLEMQVINYGDWPERSLQYLSRAFDNLSKGDTYADSKTAIHIGVISFDPFDGKSRLRETYRLMSPETLLLYTDKFQIYTLCLPHAEQATDEDIRCHTNLWARYFSAKTWEELIMLAKEDEGIASAIDTANTLWEDEEVRARIQAREDYYRRVRTEQAKLANETARREEAEAKQVEAEKKRLEAEAKQAEAEKKRLEAEAKQAEAEKKRLEAEAKQAEVEAKQAEIDKELDEARKKNQELRKEIERLQQELGNKG